MKYADGDSIIRVDYKGRVLRVAVTAVSGATDTWVVALHGIQSNKEMFEGLYSQSFLDSFPKLAISLVGFGDSDKPADFSYEMQDQAGVVELVLDELGVGKMHLVGHSLGGMVGTLLLGALRNRVLSFANLEGNLVYADCGASKDVALVSEVAFVGGGYEALKAGVAGSGEKSAQARSRWLEKIPAFVFYRTSRSIVAWSRSEKLRGLFNGSQSRRLFIYGEKNRRKAEVVSQGVELAEIPGAGHFMLLDNSKASYEALRSFIGTLPTGRQGVSLRPLRIGVDEAAFLAMVDEDRNHLSRHANRISVKYHSASDVSKSWQQAEVDGEMHWGIWDDNELEGEIHAAPDATGTEVEVGLWLRAGAVRRGYATLAIAALTDYLMPRYPRIFADVHPDNAASMRALERAGYVRVSQTERDWGTAIIFEPKR